MDQEWSDNYVVRNMRGFLDVIRSERSMKLAAGFLIFAAALAIVGPSIAPYDPGESLYNDSGELLRATPPSLEHPLGTNDVGQDVMSRIIIGARPTLLAGFLGGTIIISIGLTVGLLSGYLGGYVDDILMRIDDFAYSIPIIPFAIVLVAFIGVDFLSTIFIIGIVLWRTSARVIRSQVLQIKERPYILSAKATGANTPRIIIQHILPNVASMAILYFSLGIAYTVIVQSSLAFVGAANPFSPSWGVMIRNAYASNMMGSAWWWAISPGIMLSLTVLSAYMFARGYEMSAGHASENATLQE